MRANRTLSVFDPKATSGLVWILSFVVGGVFSAIFDAWYLSLWTSSPGLALRATQLLTPLIHALSYLVPIIARSRAVVLATGDTTRATAVPILYGMDWIICIVAALPSLPLTIQTARKRVRDFGLENRNFRKTLVQIEREQRGTVLLYVAAVIGLEESWLGSFFPGTSMFFNHVEWRNGDYYRLAWFLPLTLMLTSLAMSDLFLRWRTKGI